MIKLFKYVILAMTAISACPVYAANNVAAKPLEVGVVPYISARALISSYEPMRLYLAQALGRPVQIYTATGFKQFFFNAQNGDYDLVITAAHLARLLQKEQKFTPLVRYAGGNRCMIMTALDSPIKSMPDLKGKTIALPDRLSLASIGCMTYLRESDLQPGTHFQLLEVPSFASAILAVQKGDAVAAVSAPAALAQMPRELSESVRPVVSTDELFNLIFLAHPRLGNATAEQLNKALLKFGNESSEGKQFLISTGFRGIIPASSTDMNSLDRYVTETKRLLSEKP
jgi:phosphonate transport system substrate-binding protein